MPKRTQLIAPKVYDYVLRASSREPDVLARLRKATDSVPHNEMQIGADQGQLLAFLVKLIGARRCIEIGTYTGYSALAVALALPANGLLVACDISEEWANIGRPFWREAGVESRIDLRIKPALETLDELLAGGAEGTFDFAFVDARKSEYPDYHERVVRLLRSGGLAAYDNVLWGGAVADDSKQDADTLAIRRLNDRLASDERVTIAMLPLADGVTLARKR